MLITKEEKLAQVMIQIRKCFNQMKALSDRMHQSYGVTSAMRSVVEYLAQHGSDTVPRIARKKSSYTATYSVNRQRTDTKTASRIMR